MNKIKILVISLGCVKNRVDTEMMLGILQEGEKYEIIDDPESADVIIINTCGFINDAKKESIETIFEAAKYKEITGLKGVVVTGCLSKRYKETLFEQIPEANVFLGTENYHDIQKAVETAYRGERAMFFENECIDYDSQKRILTSYPHLAYIKIAEGCNNRCTYCAIPFIRGAYRSRKIEDIIDEVTYLALKGVKEVVLIAQDTTKYGTDIYGEKSLVKLIQNVSKVKGVEWIRVLYLYPEDIDDALLNEVYHNDMVCNYIDMPVQHFSDSILKSMNRRSNRDHILKLCANIKKNYPNITLRTTLMVGFPGETEQDYELLKESVEKIKFDHLGVFAFSKEEDTAAELLDDNIEPEVKQLRKNEIMLLQQNISYENNQKKLSQVYPVIIDEYDENIFMYIARSYEFAPDSDGYIYVTSEKPLQIGEFYNIKIIQAEHYDLMGEVVE